MSKSPKESTIQSHIIKYLKGRGGVVLNFHGGTFQAPGIPDLYYAEKGLGQMWFEVKRPGEPHPVTDLQAALFDRLEAQGVPVFVVHSVEEVVACLGYMDHLPMGHVPDCGVCAAGEPLRWQFRKEVKSDARGSC
jgi:hypothetical protein